MIIADNVSQPPTSGDNEPFSNHINTELNKYLQEAAEKPPILYQKHKKPSLMQKQIKSHLQTFHPWKHQSPKVRTPAPFP